MNLKRFQCYPDKYLMKGPEIPSTTISVIGGHEGESTIISKCLAKKYKLGYICVSDKISEWNLTNWEGVSDTSASKLLFNKALELLTHGPILPAEFYADLVQISINEHVEKALKVIVPYLT